MSAHRSPAERASRVVELLEKADRDRSSGGTPSCIAIGDIHNSPNVTINVVIGAALAPSRDDERKRRLRGIRARIAHASNGAAKLAEFLAVEFDGVALDELDDDAIAQVYSWSFSLLVAP